MRWIIFFFLSLKNIFETFKIFHLLFFFLLLSSCEINIYIIILMVFLKSNFLCINSHETWNMCWCTLLSYCHALKIYTFVLMIIHLVTYYVWLEVVLMKIPLNIPQFNLQALVREKMTPSMLRNHTQFN